MTPEQLRQEQADGEHLLALLIDVYQAARALPALQPLHPRLDGPLDRLAAAVRALEAA